MTITHIMHVSATADEVAELLCSERYNQTIQEERDDVVRARYEAGADGDRELHYEMHITSYKRTKTGGMDRSSTTDSRTVYRFEKGPKVLHWRHVGDQDRVDVYGVTRVFSQGSGARIEREVTIEVKIPVIGRGIARLIEGEFKKGYDKLESQINRLLAER